MRKAREVVGTSGTQMDYEGKRAPRAAFGGGHYGTIRPVCGAVAQRVSVQVTGFELAQFAEPGQRIEQGTRIGEGSSHIHSTVAWQTGERKLRVVMLNKA